ncbi:MAG: 30S ribosomal protein S18 [Candidatus Azambacteria bacterium]|nr:30S ribosomal protein S18 [Candidatus Azambacteria bacterium]
MNTDTKNLKSVCYFCAQNIKDIDYKNADMLRHFISAQAKIMPRKRSHLCAKHQRHLAIAIKRARFMALLPFSAR